MKQELNLKRNVLKKRITSNVDLHIQRLPKDRMRAYLAAKQPVNMGELSKAMSQFKTIGVARISPLVKKEVGMKFEKTDGPPVWPTNKGYRNEDDLVLGVCLIVT